MIRVFDGRRDAATTGAVWVGNSGDEATNLKKWGIGAVLNVAQDLATGHTWWHGMEVAHVGLIDGPGNETSMYASAVLALHALLQRHNVLVCCHSGGRALAVALMYLNVAAREKDLGWWLAVTQERTEATLPAVNPCHSAAFEALDWVAISRVMGM